MTTAKIPACGIVMPISTIDGCPESHWSDVLAILTDAITHAGFEPNLVSNADDVGVIQKRIVENLYNNPIIVCDVSGKNPNVMFELGMRLAFDRPTLIIKDDKTSYSFDTAPIEHLIYPRDLRFAKIVEFKAKLVEKLKGTHAAAQQAGNYTTFLKHFGSFKVAKLETLEVSANEYILEELKQIRVALSKVESKKSEQVSVDEALIEFAFKVSGSLKGFDSGKIYHSLNSSGIETVRVTHSADTLKIVTRGNRYKDVVAMLAEKFSNVNFASTGGSVIHSIVN